ncbi:MAG: TAXI family TRAP transporter solute-binding subunit [Campylobacteraceae bacterium]|nr:TAXI family TRAP transporter solute-binding subunit [Campylobacteraceae bacterium]
MTKLGAIAILSLISHPSFALERITIGTGGLTGTYYPTGAAICRMVNKLSKDVKIRCSVEATQASVYNINSINNSELDLGIAQSDVVYQASRGNGQFKGKQVKKLRSVMAIYPELLTFVTRTDSNIKSLKDIKNKRINIGNKGSGTEGTVLTLFKENNIKKSQLKYAGSLNAVSMPDALRDNKIDAYFYIVGHPNANIKIATDASDAKIIPLKGQTINSLLKKYPYFAKASIPAGMYKNNNKKIETFGVKAVLVASTDVKDETIYELVKVILENFESFKKLHPVYANITKASLLDGLSAPLHKGAKKYFKEAGLL